MERRGDETSEALSDLIGRIYDTVVDPARWPAVLGDIALFTNAAGAHLILENAADPQASIAYHSIASAEMFAQYLAGYMLLNPARLAMMGRVATGDTVLTRDFSDLDAYARTRFSREFLERWGVMDLAAAVLEITNTSVTVLSLARSREQGFADETLRRKLTIVAPHVRRAAAIGRVLEQRKLEAATLGDTLDRLAGAVLLLDPDGVLLHANESARTLLAAGALLSEGGGRLLVRDPAARAILTEALRCAERGDAALASRGLSVPLATGGDTTWIATLMPLAQGARQAAGAPYRAAAALCVSQTGFQPPSAIAAMSRLYGLTPRETTVMLAIVEHGGIPEVAPILGLSPNTIRGHVKAIFRKTGTGRQADLVKLLAGLRTPFG